ncbi:PREDICTED: mucin-1 isoform X10 [Propithecus coquereli]|uniref:mucin-1 isoform X10 n=1 Tax=Propithecus coquereli TaxID=379532 RepID=UPI00063EDDE1|nr:PREDICTED: mucin-1 isoform X10 [Propithecus coquereli]
MTPGIQSSFFLLLLLVVFTVSTDFGHTSSSPSRETETLSTQSHPPSSSTERTAIPAPTTSKSCRETFRNWPGSVVVESTLAFREASISVQDVKTQLLQNVKEADKYNLNISRVSVQSVPIPSSAQSGSGVPGWGIALLVLVCILVALAIIYLVALAVCQCRRKNYGQLDIFPTRDAYHPMSEYPTYHTHGRYVPPGSTSRSPYEEVSSGNGGSSLSYTNPAVAATSANL